MRRDGRPRTAEPASISTAKTISEPTVSHPADTHPADTPVTSGTYATGLGAQDARIAARRRWAYRMVQRCENPPPSYGTAAWLELPEGDYRKVAAVVIAAESWARDGDELVENLTAEVEAMRVAHKQLDDAEYVQRRDAHREEWRGKLRLVRGAYADSPEFRDGGRAS